jgi:ankyrin repeat protein
MQTVRLAATSASAAASRRNGVLQAVATATAAATVSYKLTCSCSAGPADIGRALTDADWYEKQHAHISLHLPLVEEGRQGWWHEVTRRIRECGESVNSCAADGTTLLHHAAIAGRRRLVEELLELGATPSRDMRGRTPMLCAAECGRESVLQTLAEHDAAFDVNEQDATGASALSIAARLGHIRLVRCLCSRRELTPTATDHYGVSALHKAVSFGQTACVEALLADPRVIASIDQPVGQPTVPDSYRAQTGGESALILAAAHTYTFHHTNHIQIARLLLAANADPNVTAANGRTAVHCACAAGNLKVLQELIASGRVRPTTWLLCDADGKTPLDHALGNAAIRKLVLPKVRSARERCP